MSVTALYLYSSYPVKNYMGNFNIDAQKQLAYDAIVIGSSISGG
jgi:hypothetical protein